MQTMKEKYWKYSLIALILGLGAVIVGELWAFVNGLLGAFTIFVLVRGQMIRLTERWHWPRVLATGVVVGRSAPGPPGGSLSLPVPNPGMGRARVMRKLSTSRNSATDGPWAAWS